MYLKDDEYFKRKVKPKEHLVSFFQREKRRALAYHNNHAQISSRGLKEAASQSNMICITGKKDKKQVREEEFSQPDRQIRTLHGGRACLKHPL